MRDFAKFAVDPNCAPYGIKTRPGRGIFASGPPVFSFSDVALSIGPFLCHGIRLLCNDKCHGKIARAYGHSYQMVRKELPATALSLCIAYQSLMWMRSIFISPPFCPVSKAILPGDPRTQMEPSDEGCQRDSPSQSVLQICQLQQGFSLWQMQVFFDISVGPLQLHPDFLKFRLPPEP